MTTTTNQPARARSLPLAWRVELPIAATAIVLVLAYGPLLVQYGRHLWSLPHYQFFPLAMVAAGVLVHSRIKELTSLQPGCRLRSAALLAAALLLLLVAVLLDSPLSAAVSALVLVLAVAYSAGGGALLMAVLPGWIFLWLIIRPPLNFDLALIGWLQQQTAQAASAVLDLLGVIHVLAGNVVELPGRQLLVEEACSGIHSLFSALACTLFYLLWTRRRWAPALVVLLTVPFWVMLANLARVVLVTALRAKWDIAAEQGVLHQVLGLGIFVVAMCLVLSTDRLLMFISPHLAPTANVQAAQKHRPDVSLRGSLLAWRWPAAVCGVLVLMQVAMAVRTERDPPHAVPMAQRLAQLEAESMPHALHEWQRVGFNVEQRDVLSIFGEHSRAWQYAREQRAAVLSLDYPFSGWHPLPVCYLSHGWSVDARREHAGEGPARMSALLSKPEQRRYAHLVFAVFDEHLQPLEPQLGEVQELGDRIHQRLRRWSTLLSGQRVPVEVTPTTYQLQLFVESYTPLDEPQRQQLDAMFLTGWRKLADHWRPATAGAQ